MLPFHHGWGWQPPHTASCIYLRYIQNVWAHWYAVHGNTLAALHRYAHITYYLAQVLGFWVTCGVNMMSLNRSWGWQPPPTASRIHIRQIQSVWAHWYAVHWNTVAALHRYTHITWFRFWVLGHSTCGVKMMSLRHGWGWQPSQTASYIHARYIQSVWAHWYAVHWHTVVALHSYTHIT